MIVHFYQEREKTEVAVMCQMCYDLVGTMSLGEAAELGRTGQIVQCFECDGSGVDDVPEIFQDMEFPEFMLIGNVYVLIDPFNDITPEGYVFTVPKEVWEDFLKLNPELTSAPCLSFIPKLSKLET